MTDHNALAPRSNPSPTGDRAARAYLSRCFDSALSTMLRAHTACTNRAAVLSTMAGAVRDHRGLMADPYIREQFANMDCETAARRERANVARLDDALVARVRELVERLPLALSIAQHGGGGGLLALQRALALEGLALTGDPTTWPAQVETIQATEHARAMRDIDAAEQRARLDVS